MPGGGVRPSGSTSWRPRARIAWRTVPGARRRAAVAERGLGDGRPTAGPAWSCDLDHLGHQREGVGAQARRSAVRCERLGAEQDRLAEAQLVDAADVRRCAAPRRGSPSCRRRRSPARCPTRASTCSTSPDSSSILAWSGTTPLWQARLVPSPRQAEPGRARDAPARRRPRRRARPRGGRRARPSAPRRGVVRWRTAAAESASSTDGLGVEADVGDAHDRVDLAEHRRPDQRERRLTSPRPGAAARFSTRESPRPLTPPRSMAAADGRRARAPPW